MLTPWKGNYDKPRQHIQKQRHYFADKGPSSQSYGFSSSYVWMWELDCEDCWRIDAFELWCWRRLLRVPWTARRSTQSILKEISPEHSLGWCWSWNIHWNDVEAETPILWPLDAKNWLIGKDHAGGRDGRQEEKRMTEDGRIGYHHQLPELAQTHVYQVSDAIEPSHPLSSPSPAVSLSHHRGLFTWVSSLHQVAKVLELQLQHQPFQWIFRIDFLYDWWIWSPCSPRYS